jgi:hypothetical protein
VVNVTSPRVRLPRGLAYAPMNAPPPTHSYQDSRLPAEIISHGLRLYYRLCLRDCDVEALLTGRGVILTGEAGHYRSRLSRQTYANP